VGDRDRGRDRGSVTEEHNSTSEQTPPLAALAERETTDPEFAAFYDAYPRRKDRRAAEKAWRAAIRRGATPAHMIASAARYAEITRNVDARYVKYPASWLNAAAYDDEQETPRLALVSGGYQPFHNPTDQSVYDEPLLPANPQEMP
jgi:hypothetical protein